MNNIIRYIKPNLTNLPHKLGVEIFKQILSTPTPDRAILKAQSDLILEKMIKIREREEKNSTFI